MAARKKAAVQNEEKAPPRFGRFIVELHELQLAALGGPAATAERFGATLLGCVVSPHDRVARVELEA